MNGMIRVSWVVLFCVVGVNAQTLKNLDLTLQSTSTALPTGVHFGEVVGVVTNSEDHLFVLNRGPQKLVELDDKGRYIREIGQGLLDDPHGLRLDASGNIWTTDAGTHLVLRFNPAGRVTMVLGMRNKSGKGWFHKDYNLTLFDRPTDVALDEANHIYVTDRGNARVVKFDADGRALSTWGDKGTEPGQFEFPHSILAHKGKVYVADRENKRIQIFSDQGAFLTEWNHIGYPYVLTMAPDQTIWMTDARAERVLKMNLDGKILGAYDGIAGRGDGQLGFVHGIHVTRSGRVYLSEVLNWRIQHLATSKNRLDILQP